VTKGLKQSVRIAAGDLHGAEKPKLGVSYASKTIFFVSQA